MIDIFDFFDDIVCCVVDFFVDGYCIIFGVVVLVMIGVFDDDFVGDFDCMLFGQGGFYGNMMKWFGCFFIWLLQVVVLVQYCLIFGIVEVVLLFWCDWIQFNIIQVIVVYFGVLVQFFYCDQK